MTICYYCSGSSRCHVCSGTGVQGDGRTCAVCGGNGRCTHCTNGVMRGEEPLVFRAMTAERPAHSVAIWRMKAARYAPAEARVSAPTR